jgi:hypothetical protein
VLVVVDENDVMTKVGKAGACHQSDVSGTHHSNPHVSNSRVKSFGTGLFSDVSKEKSRGGKQNVNLETVPTGPKIERF